MGSILRAVGRILAAAAVFGLLLVGLQAGSATRGNAVAAPTPIPEKVTDGIYIQNVQHVDLATNRAKTKL